MVDSNDIARGDGPMAPTRCGSLPVRDVVEMCYSGKYSEKEMLEKVTKTAALPITWAQAMPGKSKSGPMQEMRTQR